MSEEATKLAFQDSDLVYVDPKLKKVIGPVQWEPNGKPKKVEMVFVEEAPEKKEEGDKPAAKKHKPRKYKRYYPWCSYKTAKKVYKVEGKFIEKEEYGTFEEILAKALKEPFWDD